MRFARQMTAAAVMLGRYCKNVSPSSRLHSSRYCTHKCHPHNSPSTSLRTRGAPDLDPDPAGYLVAFVDPAWSMYCSEVFPSMILSLRFDGHFPGEPGLAGVYWNKGWWRWWWQLKLQSSSQIITSNKPTSSFYRPDALPVAQPTVSNQPSNASTPDRFPSMIRNISIWRSTFHCRCDVTVH